MEFFKKISQITISTICAMAIASGAFAATISFRTDAEGIRTTPLIWGLGHLANTANKIAHLGGAQMLTYMRIGCPNEWALEEDIRLSSEAIAEIDSQMESVLVAFSENPSLQLGLVCSGGQSINEWYVQTNGLDIRGERWLALIKAMINYVQSTYGIRVGFIEVANEHDYNQKKGRSGNLANIMERFQDDPDLGGIPQVGPSTLSSDAAMNWYPAARNVTDWGATHAINGSRGNYIDFIRTVRADGKVYWASEIHHLAEMMFVEEHGGLGGSWWPYHLSATEGFFATAQRGGNRIFYSEANNSFGATSAYRSADGQSIHIFADTRGDETFTFTVTDRSDVFFNGIGPQTSFSVTPGGNAEYIEVTWGGGGGSGGGGDDGSADCPASHPFACGGFCYEDAAQAAAGGCVP